MRSKKKVRKKHKARRMLFFIQMSAERTTCFFQITNETEQGRLDTKNAKQYKERLKKSKVTEIKKNGKSNSKIDYSGRYTSQLSLGRKEMVSRQRIVRGELETAEVILSKCSMEKHRGRRIRSKKSEDLHTRKREGKKFAKLVEEKKKPAFS